MLIRLIACFISFTCCQLLSAQPTDLVEHYGVKYELHQQNVSRITFLSEYIAMEEYQSDHFLTDFELKEKATLSMRAFMTNSLTNYLHQLAPELSIEQLHEHGNYQFRFIVDEELIYTEELNIGAGTTQSKNKNTMLYIPLAGGKKMNSWGQFMWMRFMSKGGVDALSEGSHRLRIEMRPYLQLDELVLGELIAAGEITVQVAAKPVAEKDLQFQPIAANSGWPVAKKTMDESKIRELNKKIANETLKDITSIVVAKNGELLLEEYFNGAKRKTLHDTRSVGKSFVSTLLGMAIKDGHIKNEKETLDQFYDLTKFANYTDRKNKVTLENLLTMSSGIGGSDFDSESESNEELMYVSKHWLKFALGQSMNEDKVVGKNWDYFTAGMIILADILNQKVPGGLEEYAAQQLFQKLDINKYKWQYTAEKSINTAGGLRLRALDLAKFGQLYANHGKWNGENIIPASWVDQTFTKYHELPMAADNFYGYLFWNKTFEVDGVVHEVYYASGNGGNRIYIFKDQPLVMVITSTAHNTPYGRAQADKIMQDYLIPAVTQSEKQSY